MVQIIETIDVDVPVRTAYDQWTQFETFPKFLDEVESITQLDDKHTHWKVKVGPVEREFDAEITEQSPVLGARPVVWTRLALSLSTS